MIFTERPDRGLMTLNGIARNTNNNADRGNDILQYNSALYLLESDAQSSKVLFAS